MIRILSVDTTTAHGSLALVEDDRIIEEVAIYAPDGFGQTLFGHIEALLAKWQLTLTDIDCFATTRGPGTFTGVRIGLAAMKGLAFSLGKPMCAISNLEAIASFGTAPFRGAFLDARRSEIFSAVYDSDLNLVTEEVVTSLPRWLASLDQTEVELLTTDLTACDVGDVPTIVDVRAVGTKLAGAVGLLTVSRFKKGLEQHPGAVDANYVRRADAELFWEDK